MPSGSEPSSCSTLALLLRRLPHIGCGFASSPTPSSLSASQNASNLANSLCCKTLFEAPSWFTDPFYTSHYGDGLAPCFGTSPQSPTPSLILRRSSPLSFRIAFSSVSGRNGPNKAGSWEAKGKASSAEQNTISKPGDSHRQAMSAGCRGWCSRGTGYSTHAARKKRDTLLS